MIWWYDKAIKHQKLNNVENPCNDSPGYKYQSCIVGKMLEKLKCQPFWLNISQTLKTCTEVEKMQKLRILIKEVHRTHQKIQKYCKKRDKLWVLGLDRFNI